MKLEQGERPDAQLAVAIELLRSGQADQARQIFTEVLARNPGQPDALHGFAIIAHQRGDRAGAEAALRRLIAAFPERISALYDLACMLIEQGADSQAHVLLEKVVTHAPQFAAAWYQLGFVRKKLWNFEGSERALKRCLSINSGHAAGSVEMAHTLRDRGEYAAALELFDQTGRKSACPVDYYLMWGQFLTESALPEQALDVYRRAVELYPEHVDLQIGYGQALEGKGDRAAAEQAYRRALRADSNRGFALGSLLALIGDSIEAPLIERAESILADSRARPAAKALIGYGLGKAHQSKKHYAGAFSAWQYANAARREETGGVDHHMLAEQVGDLTKAFTAETFRRFGDLASTDQRPTLIVGMPRSGTTLIEQVLGAHSSIAALGELPDLPVIAGSFVRRNDGAKRWPTPADLGDGHDIPRAAKQYLAALEFRSPEAQAQRIVDKAPLNFFNLGLLALLFPRARIIWCRRDPRDVCLSIFSENFAPSQKYATDLGDLGFYYQQQERLMRHWQRELPNPMLEVRYEDFVRNPEVSARALIGFMGLPWENSCLEFHRSSRAVQTPSRWQVRQPVYVSSIGRWRRYDKWLDPLLSIWGDQDLPIATHPG